MSEETEHTVKVTWAPTGQGEPLQAALWPQRRGPGSPPQGSRNRHLSRDEGPPARHHLPHDRPTHLQTRGRQSKARSRNDTYVGRPPPPVPDRRSSSSTPTPRHTLALASGPRVSCFLMLEWKSSGRTYERSGSRALHSSSSPSTSFSFTLRLLCPLSTELLTNRA